MPASCSLGTLLLLAASACHSPRGSLATDDTPTVADVALSNPPFTEVHCNWKERIAQPYVYLEFKGSYAVSGRNVPEVARLMSEQGLTASGPPFGLYYDDPGEVPIDQLRSRLCFPVELAAQTKEPLRADVLPSATVAYAVVSGRYPDVPRCYPGLLAYMKRMHWAVAGPIREVYWVPPGSVSDWSALRCEVQVPVAMAP